MTILAKSRREQIQYEQSLRGHLSDVRTAARFLLTPTRLKTFARLGVDALRAEKLLMSAVWLHDWGKATREWQTALRTNQSLPQHSLTGFLACLWAMGIGSLDKLPDDSLDLLAVALAVLGHHGQLSDGSFQESNFTNQYLTIEWDEWDDLLKEVPLRGVPTDRPSRISAKFVCGLVSHAKYRLGRPGRDLAFRGLYCLLLTLLVEADHAASGGQMPDTRIIVPPHLPDTATSLQKSVQTQAGQVLCGIAGCGSGKTAAALLRAAKFATDRETDRVVLCLPTRFTGNSLLRDMSDPDKSAYPMGQVGLVHSEALQVLRNRSKQDEEDFPDEEQKGASLHDKIAREIAEKSIRYGMPVTVSTVDHLLMSLYHGYKFADRAFGNLLSSLVVFDEVHAYDATTLNAIREGMNVLSHYGIPTLFMSATLPSSRRRFFGLSDERTVIEQDNPYKPFRIHRLEESLTIGQGIAVEATNEARRCLRDAKGLKLAVYVNQVERAKALARAARKELPDVPIFCYHSELVPRDRQALETKVIKAFNADSPVVLIATQAAELSLDISAERMITELAPADVLVQRAGRLHRRGLLPELPVATSRLPVGFAFQLLIAPLDLTLNDKGECPAALPYKDAELLQKTLDNAPWDQEFIFNHGLAWCETVLTDTPPVIEIGLQEASRKDAVFGKKPQENFAGEDNADGVTIRDIDDDVVLVLPAKYFSEPTPTLTDLAQLQVPIRRRKFYAIDPGLVEKQARQFTVGRGHQSKTIDYELTIIKSNLCYDAEGGGFDFRTDKSVLVPNQTDDNFI